MDTTLVFGIIGYLVLMTIVVLGVRNTPPAGRVPEDLPAPPHILSSTYRHHGK